MLTINNLYKKFNDKILYENFNFTFDDKGLYIIKGQNGRGKTTLLNMIYGFEKPDMGDIYFNEIKIDDTNIDTLRRENVGYMRQTSNLNQNLTVYENLELSYILKYGNNNDFDKKISETLKKLNCLQLKRRKIDKLSGGEKARINFARLLICDFNIFLLDEPSANLDLWNREDMYSIIKELSNEKLIILVSHDLDEINLEGITVDLNQTTYNLTIENKAKNNLNLKKEKKHSFYPFIKFFKKFNLINSFLVLLLAILTSSLCFLNYNRYSNYDSIPEYIIDNNIKAIKSSKRTDNLNSLLYKDFDIFRSDNKVLMNLGVDDFYTLSDETKTFYYENELSKFQLLWLCGNIFDNVIIDNSLVENHIKVTSQTYDFLKYENKIKDNYIQNQTSKLYIDSVCKRDYYAYNEEEIKNYFSGSKLSEDFKKYHEYNSQIWMNSTTYKYLSTHYQGFDIYHKSDMYTIAYLIKNSEEYGVYPTIGFTYDSFCGFFPESSPKKYDTPDDNSIIISKHLADVLSVNVGDYLHIDYGTVYDHQSVTNLLITGIFDIFEQENNTLYKDRDYFVVSNNVYNKVFQYYYKGELECDYSEYYYLDDSKENYIDVISELSKLGETLVFANSTIVYNDINKTNEFFSNISIFDKIMIFLLLITIIIENLILAINRQSSYYFYRSIGVSKKEIHDYILIFKTITLILLILLSIALLFVIKISVIKYLSFESNYVIYINYKKIAFIYLFIIIIDFVFGLLSLKFYDDKKIDIKIKN